MYGRIEGNELSCDLASALNFRCCPARASCHRHPTRSSVQPVTLLHDIISYFAPWIIANMSAEEEQYDDGSMGAPGAPTPVSALEVRVAMPSRTNQYS